MSDELEKNEDPEAPPRTMLARPEDVVEPDEVRVARSDEASDAAGDARVAMPEALDDAPGGVRVWTSGGTGDASGGVNVVVNVESAPQLTDVPQVEPMGFGHINRWGVWASWRLTAIVVAVAAVAALVFLVVTGSSGSSGGGSVDAIAHRYVVDNERQLNEVVAGIVAVRLPEEERLDAERDLRESIRWTYRPPVHLVDNLYEVSAVATAETARVRGMVPFGLIVRADAGDVARAYVQAVGAGVEMESPDSTLSVN